MRKLTELYKIVYEYIQDVPDGKYYGFCHLFQEMYDDDIITFKEELALRKHLSKNKPTQWRHIEFIADKDYLGDEEDSMYWWPRGEWKQRKLFIQKMIQVSKPWYKQIGYIWNQLRSIEKL